MTETDTYGELTFSDLEKIIRAYLRRKTGQSGDVVDDAVQEGMIYAWKDMGSGEYTDTHIVHRAQQKAWAWFRDDGKSKAVSTGGYNRSREGQALSVEAEAKKEKFRIFVEAHLSLHNQYPSRAAVIEATGLSPETATLYLSKYRNGGFYNMAQYRDEYGQRALQRPTMTSMDTPVGHDGKNTIGDLAATIVTDQFEDDLVGQMNYEYLLSKVILDKNREALDRWINGDTKQEIGDNTTWTTKSAAIQRGNRMVQAALVDIRRYLRGDNVQDTAAVLEELDKNPRLSKTCRKGHPYTVENTEIFSTKSGKVARRCLICNGGAR